MFPGAGLLGLTLPNPAIYIPLLGIVCLGVAPFRGDLKSLSKRMIVWGWGLFALTSPSAEFPHLLRPVSVALFGAGTFIAICVRPAEKPPRDRLIVASSRLLFVYVVFVLFGALASPFGPHNVFRWIEGVMIIEAAFWAISTDLTDQVLLATWFACTINVFASVASRKQELGIGTGVPDGRLAGYMEANHLAFTAAEVILGVIVLWPKKPRMRVPIYGRVSLRPALFMCGFVATYAIYASRSRTTLLALLIAMAIASFWGVKIQGKPAKILVVSIAVAVMILPFAATTIGKYVTRGQSEQGITSLTGRTDFWPLAVDLIHQRPIIGWGINVIDAPVQGAPFQAILPGVGQAHNAFLEAALQAGLIGAIAWALALVAATVGSIRLPRDDPYRWLIVCAGVITIIESITESSPAWFGDMFIVYVLCLALYSERKQHARAPEPVPAWALA